MLEEGQLWLFSPLYFMGGLASRRLKPSNDDDKNKDEINVSMIFAKPNINYLM